MATYDRDWPGHTQWYCCPQCRRLWTYQDKETVALDHKFALAPARPSEGVPPRICTACEGGLSASAIEI